MKVALVHDYLREYGGAERVLEVLHEMFPDAPIFTAYLNLKGLGPHADRVKNWDIRTSWLQKIPFANKLVSPLRVFAPLIFESFDLREYDIVISSCAVYFSKAVLTPPRTLHISYIHTPPRYLYGYATSFNYKKNPITRVLGELANHFLRIYDFETSQRPDILVANSKNVASRIEKFYRRKAVVIYPPVEVNVILNGVKNLLRMQGNSNKLRDPSSDVPRTQDDEEKKYFLSLSRLVRGKGVDTIIKACTQASLPLKVAGAGPQLNYLKSIAGPSVEFVGEVSDSERAALYANAKALIVASEDEDFGITAVESQAAGTPVIAPRAGGYLETVIDGKTGVFVEAQNLVKVLKEFDPDDFKPKDCQENAYRFSKENFKEKMVELINSNLRSQISNRYFRY